MTEHSSAPLFTTATFLSAVALVTLSACAPAAPNGEGSSSSSRPPVAQEADTPYADAQGRFTATIPAGWYPHEAGAMLIVTPSETFTLPQGTEGYAIGQQFTVREGRLDEITGARTFEDWMRGNGMADGSEWLVERSTVTLEGESYQRVVMRAATADGETLTFVRETAPGRYVVISHYPYVAGSAESADFEDFAASVRETAASGGAQSPVSPAAGEGLPLPAAQAARMAYAANLSVSASAIEIVSATPREWSDSCLGLGGPAESCAMMITEGFEVTLRYGGATAVYRTDATGTVVRKAP